MHLIFYLSLFIIFYIYIGYPITVALRGLIVGKEVRRTSTNNPYVTILIAAYNEAECIKTTISNKLSLDYPKDKIEIIVVSDASDDETDSIVHDFKDQGVILIRQNPRAGKTAALNLGVQVAKGEIIVFSDANSIYEKDAVIKIIRNFSDPSVGYVTGKMLYTKHDGSLIGDGCSYYMKYENFLRKLETKSGSVVGVDGGIDAVRKALYGPMKADQLPDFVLPLSVVDQGLRAIYEPEAILKEHSLKDFHDEYRMRVRVSLRAIWALWEMRHLLSINSYGWFAWQLLWHKLMRYACFIFLMIAWLSNFYIWQNNIFLATIFIVQSLCWFSAILPFFVRNEKLNNRFFMLCNYFFLINVASGQAFVKFLLRKKQVLWAPRKG